MKNITFATREQSRTFARSVNDKAPAKLKAAVKNDSGAWEFPGLNHGGLLTLKK